MADHWSSSVTEVPYVTVCNAFENALGVALAQLDRLVDELGFEQHVAQQFTAAHGGAEEEAEQLQIGMLQSADAGETCGENVVGELPQLVCIARIRTGEQALDDAVLPTARALACGPGPYQR